MPSRGANSRIELDSRHQFPELNGQRTGQLSIVSSRIRLLLRLCEMALEIGSETEGNGLLPPIWVSKVAPNSTLCHPCTTHELLKGVF